MCSARKLLLCYSKAGQFLTVVIAYESLPLCALLLNAALQNDTKKLAEAKQLVYLKGFTDGVMVVGDHAGKKVRCLVRWCVFLHLLIFCLGGWGTDPLSLSISLASAAAPAAAQEAARGAISLQPACTSFESVVCVRTCCLQVSEAKPLCKAEMIAAGEAILYSGGWAAGCMGACWASALWGCQAAGGIVAGAHHFSAGPLQASLHQTREAQPACCTPAMCNALTAAPAVPAEPEKPVMSRSGDECVVALTDQW